MKALLSILALILAVGLALSAAGPAAAQEPGCYFNVDADIVIMLDRTGSVSTSYRVAEATAAKDLVSSFEEALDPENRPYISVGAFGDNTNGGDEAFIVVGLTKDYGDVYAAIDDVMAFASRGGTNLADAVSVAQAELMSHSSVRDILVLTSDGDPNEPCRFWWWNCDPEQAALDAADAAKQDDIEIFCIAFGADNAGKDLLAAMATNSANDDPPGGENNDGDHFFIGPLSSAIEFIFLALVEEICPPPTIGSVNPTQGYQCDTLDVTITGTNFSGPTLVNFGDGITVTILSVSPTQITAEISIACDANPGPRDVSVTTPRGTDTLSGGFSVIAPTLSRIDVIPVDPTIALGDTRPFTAIGTYSDSSTVDITSLASWSSTDTGVATIDASGLATSLSTGTTDIRASLDGVTSPAQTLTVTQLAPNITSVIPDNGDQGDTLENVTINGTNLSGATSVGFGSGITVTILSVSPTQITASISIAGAATPGLRDVSVTAPGGTATLTDGFTVNAPSPPPPDHEPRTPGELEIPFDGTVTPADRTNFTFVRGPEKPTIVGDHSVALTVNNLQNPQEGIKIAFPIWLKGDPEAPKWGEVTLQDIDASSISLKVKGDVLYDGSIARSPFPLIVIKFGKDTYTQGLSDVAYDEYGPHLYFYPTDENGRPEITVSGDPGVEWATVTPAYSQYWKGFFQKGDDAGDFLGVVGPTDLASWHNAIFAQDLFYWGMYKLSMGVGYGFVYPSGSTVYVDDLRVKIGSDYYAFDFEPGVNGGGCFIATAAYGSYLDSHVDTLRDFRDQYLVDNPVGQALVSTYYKLSPPVAEFIDDHPALKPIVRVGLLPAVAMSTVAVNTTLAHKIAIVGSLALVSVALAVWLSRRRGKGVIS